MEQGNLCPQNTGDKFPWFLPTPEASGKKKNNHKKEFLK